MMSLLDITDNSFVIPKNNLFEKKTGIPAPITCGANVNMFEW